MINHTNEEYIFKNVPKDSKAYVQIQTNFGNLNLELFCSETPKTCFNFIMLAKKGYYNETIFHRSIKNFMLQGGDPTGNVYCLTFKELVRVEKVYGEKILKMNSLQNFLILKKGLYLWPIKEKIPIPLSCKKFFYC